MRNTLHISNDKFQQNLILDTKKNIIETALELHVKVYTRLVTFCSENLHNWPCSMMKLLKISGNIILY